MGSDQEIAGKLFLAEPVHAVDPVYESVRLVCIEQLEDEGKAKDYLRQTNEYLG